MRPGEAAGEVGGLSSLEEILHVLVTNALRSRPSQGHPVEDEVCLGAFSEPSLSSLHGPSLVTEPSGLLFFCGTANTPSPANLRERSV